MPIFEYQCIICRARTEKLVKSGEQPPPCPECGKPMKQVWSVPAVAQWSCSKGSL